MLRPPPCLFLLLQVAPLKKLFKNAKFGANFSPTGYYKISDADGSQTQACVLYIGLTFQWIRVFREGGLDLPWGEDWVWQTPVGSQQMMALSIDAFRSGMFWVGDRPSACLPNRLHPPVANHHQRASRPQMMGCGVGCLRVLGDAGERLRILRHQCHQCPALINIAPSGALVYADVWSNVLPP